MKRQDWRVAGAAILVAASTVLAGCGTPGSEPSGESGGTLKLISQSPTQGFDPVVAQTSASTELMNLFMGTLLQRDSAGEIVGQLAESWEVSEDGLTYTFVLRDTNFSDGTPVTAADVKFSIDRSREGEVSKGSLALIDSVDATDEKTVAINVASPFPNLTTELAKPGTAGILKQAAVEGNDDYFTMPDATSGPFVLDEYVPNVSASLSRSEEYFEPAKLDGLEITFDADTTAAAAALISGATDMAAVAYTDVEQLKTAGVQVFAQDTLSPIYFGWDRTRPPFDDVKVRQAFAWAIDREGAEAACWSGTGAVTWGSLVRPWDPNYIELNNYAADSRDDALAEAAALLTEAGWVAGADGIRTAQGVAGMADGTPLEVSVPYENTWTAGACHVQVLQASLKEVGVTINPEATDRASYYQQAGNGDFQMFHAGNVAVNSFDIYQNWFTCDGAATNIATKLCDPEIDAKIAAAIVEPDPEIQRAAFAELEEWQAEFLPMLVDVYQFAQVGVSSKVQGFQPSTDLAYSLVRVSK